MSRGKYFNCLKILSFFFLKREQGLKNALGLKKIAVSNRSLTRTYRIGSEIGFNFNCERLIVSSCTRVGPLINFKTYQVQNFSLLLYTLYWLVFW